MSVETGSRAQASLGWNPGLDGHHGLAGLGTKRPAHREIAEVCGPAASRRRDALFRRMLVGADVAAIAGAFVLMAAATGGSLRPSWAAAAGLPLLLVVAKLIGLYDRDEMLLCKTTLDEAPKLFHLATLCALVTWLAAGPALVGAVSRLEALVLWSTLVVLLIAARGVARALAVGLSPAERCLLIGDSAAAMTIGSRLGNRGGVKAELIARVDFEHAGPWSTDTFSAPRLAEIADLAHALDVHRAIIAPRSADAGEMLNLVRTLKAVGVRVSVLPRLLEVVGSSVEFDDLDGVTVMGVRRFDLTRSSAACKRVLDLLAATVGLIAVSPLMLAIALAIRLDSPGHVLFRQLRVGRHGRRFEMFKFRTMIPEADTMKESLRDRNEAAGGLFKIAEDPRVTRVGRLLRRSGLDELPQLLNVLKGEMSLVGPRPLVVEEDERVEGWHRRRLELMPGITGPWQILGPARVPLGEMVAMDYLYVADWSLWKDVKIMLRTIPHVLGRRGL
jgi:exopolysaccharide biosynthesis polyprenyl glycosylphosphotransferase